MTLIELEDASTLTQAGGKASSLQRLLAQGINVPPGVVVPARHFAAFVEASGQADAIAELARGVRLDDPQGLEDASARIASWLMSTPLDASLRAALEPLLADKGWARVAVRSSAVGEDGARASFAGQLDSFLDVGGADALIESVKKVWCSYYSARAMAYQKARGVTLRGMAVIVQAQIEGAVSGVTFTASPEDHELMRVEYVAGGCEALVSGEVTPEVLLLRRGERSPRGDLRVTPESALMTPEQVRELAAACLDLEELGQAPQDIEWTFDPEGTLHVLQTRPITVAAPRARAPEEQGGDRVVYSNSNINENFPGPVSPLLQSVARASYYHYFRAIAVAYGFSPRRVEAMEAPLRQIVEVHGQRLYYNVSNIHAVMRMAPWGDMFADWFNAFVGVTDQTEARAQDMTWGRGRLGRVSEVAEMVAIAAQVTRQYSRLPEQVRTFEATVDSYAARNTVEELAGLDADALIARVAGFSRIRNSQWIGAGLSDGACMVCCGALEWFLGRHFEGDSNVLLHGLLRGLPDIVSSEPPRHLWRLSRLVHGDDALRALFEEDTQAILDALGWDGARMDEDHPLGGPLQTFLDDWGFRCTGELMLTVSSFQEDPGSVIDMLRSYLQIESDGPDHVIEAQGRKRLAQSAELAAELDPARAFVFAKLQQATGGSLALRERSRLKQALLYRCLRRVALALGSRWHQDELVLDPDDVFFLYWQEILAVGDGATIPNDVIAERKAQHARESQWPAPPPSFRLPVGERWDPSMAEEMEQPADSVQDMGADGSTLTGIAAAGGVVTGRAAVALSKEDFHHVEAGDILVAPQTDPGWATVLFLVRGLVMERGGMLSHGAIIAREFGIPSVIAVPNATTAIPQKSALRVDGDRGHVHLLD